MSSSKIKNELEISERGRNAHGAASTDLQKLHLNEIQQLQYSEAPKMMRAAILPPKSHNALCVSTNRNHLLHDDIFAQSKISKTFPTGNGEKFKEDTSLKKPGSTALGVHLESITWRVRHESLTCVPKYVKVARTHVFLNNTDAGIVTKRISDCLRELSIHASFNDNQAMAECESPDSIKFIIQLYRGRGKFANGVIVEIQRMHGCCMRFMQCCRSILQAAENVKVAQNKVPGLPISKMNLAQPRRPDTSCEKIENQCTLSMKMSCICRLIFENGRDSQALGVEMLRDATDPSKVGANHASKAVKSLFDGEYMKVFNYITSLIDLKPLVDDNVEKKFRLRFLALCTLSNVLLVAASVGDLPEIIKKNLWFVDSLVLTLIEDLKNSKICSNSALQAAKCLNHVVSASHDAKAKAIEIDAVQAVILANEYGRYSHALLEKETECCVKSLQCH